MEKDIESVEKELDDDAEAVIINERYLYIERILKGCSKNPEFLGPPLLLLYLVAHEYGLVTHC